MDGQGLDPTWTAVLRLGVFLGLMGVFMGAEALWPRRSHRTHGRIRRWPSNLGLVVLDGLMVRGVVALLPIALPVALAHVVAERGWGLLNLLALPVWLDLLVGVLAQDCVIWVQHMVFHRIPLLWRLHRVHHADTDFDVTTALRFHPLEILLSLVIKGVAVVVIGPSPLAVLIFEVLLNGTAMFNHADMALSQGLDRGLRLLVVTPDMHRVHHSVHREEMDSNFGFCFPWWDRLFGTYRSQPRDGHGSMAIGLETLRAPIELTVWRLLTQPFRGVG
ncbi:MAG: sterol desaturase family protein [Rhodospirillum sp.]|nr:sterol desaturase family protein [Rhodospirillum sp.]MCF8490827.1 sterol desaturase family protein [Rhodospirillum sp.]MCF8501386.1 sterol desaturase family protein [Rhodospirillum sp.]